MRAMIGDGIDGVFAAERSDSPRATELAADLLRRPVTLARH